MTENGEVDAVNVKEVFEGSLARRANVSSEYHGRCPSTNSYGVTLRSTDVEALLKISDPGHARERFSLFCDTRGQIVTCGCGMRL
jgi:hypothetical protein